MWNGVIHGNEGESFATFLQSLKQQPLPFFLFFKMIILSLKKTLKLFVTLWTLILWHKDLLLCTVFKLSVFIAMMTKWESYADSNAA